MGIKLTNNAFATLAAGINSSATSITLTTGQGARFPTLTASDYFYATLIDTSNNLEIVKCTARSTDVLTVVRGQESTTARAYVAGDRIEIRLTAQTFIDAVNEIGPTQVSDEDNSSTGYFDLPVGTTGQRPGSPAAGMQRFNSTIGYMEYYDGATWNAIASPYSIEYLLVAGGGGGGAGRASNSWWAGGGGGAGGAIDSSQTVAPTNAFTIVVGAGGNGQVAGTDHQNATGVNGNNTTAFSLTAIGGGAGGSYIDGSTVNGRNGGSGGGSGAATASTSGGSGTAGQGNAGGAGTSSGTGSTGGGGGAGAAGGNAADNVSGNGGVGINWKSLGTFYAGGGGGGASTAGSNSATPGSGGNGGGAAGRVSVGGGAVGNAGSANTGGGGGGIGGDASISNSGGAGGSGVVIIRYTGAQKGTGGTVTSSGGYTYHTFTSSGTYTA
jgi:hypothetical protein